MNNILIFSQDGNFTIFVRSIAIGRKQENYLIGDKLKKLLNERKMTSEELISVLGNSYRDNVNRVLNNKEIPKKPFLDKLIRYFNIADDYFLEKELENIIITDNGLVIGEYENNDKARAVKQQLDMIIEENTKSNKPIILHMPKIG